MATPLLVVACILVDTKKQILISCRPKNKPLAGQWEFPGGKIEPNETPEEAIVRELQEELGVTIKVEHLAPFTFISHGYEDFHLLLLVYTCRQWHGTTFPLEGQQLAWVSPADYENYPIIEVDRQLIPLLNERL